jgi:hypothetical protein
MQAEFGVATKSAKASTGGNNPAKGTDEKEA